MRTAPSAVPREIARQRTSLDSMRSKQHEGRSTATPSGFERNAATVLLSPACPGLDRVGALPRHSPIKGPAAVHPKEFYVKRISHIGDLA